MSKKDFELIAFVIRNLTEAPEVRARIAQQFAKELKYTNERFDVQRFLRACDPS